MQTATRVVRDYIQRGHIAKSLANPQSQRLRAAAYCRVSSDRNEQLESYDAQVKHYTKFIKEKPEWEFVGVYADEGITGTKLRKRKEFQRMIADAMAGKIDIIIVKSVSRFARNTVDSLTTVRDLREKGVRVFFESQNIDSLDPKCDMILSIYSSLAEEESRTISGNIKWRKKKQVEDGEVSYNFNLLYGYRQNDGVVSIYEPEAEIIREMFFGILIGKSYQNIVDDFAQRNIPTPKKGTAWRKSTIKSILENEKYMGDVLLAKTYKRDVLSDKRVKNTGQSPQKYIENNHPAIVDRTTWNAVQVEIERRNGLRSTSETGKGRFSWQYPFSGIIFCGECGASYRRHFYRGEGAWVCKQHVLSKNHCKALPIKEKRLEELFVKTLNSLIFDHNKVANTLEIALAEAVEEAGETTPADNELADIDRKIAALQENMAELCKQRGSIHEQQAIIVQLDDLFAQRERLAETFKSTATSEYFRKTITEFMSHSTTQTEFDRDIFTKLVAEIRIKSRDNIVFEFRDGSFAKAVTE